MTGNQKLQVFYDAQCVFCTASMTRMKALDFGDALQFRDLNAPESLAEASGRFTAHDLAREMHVHMPDGTWRVGYFALAEIVRQLPVAGALASLMLLPPIAEIGHAAYKYVAAHRYGIAGRCALGACRLDARK